MILNVGPALFVAALFSCLGIILNPVVKETMFPVKTFACSVNLKNNSAGARQIKNPFPQPC